MPPACDRTGQGPCGPGGSGGGTGGGTGGAGNDGPGAGGTPTGGPSTSVQVDPETGLLSGGEGDAGGADLAGSPTEMAAFRSDGMSTTLGVLIGVQILLVLLVPPFVARAARRRRDSAGNGG